MKTINAILLLTLALLFLPACEQIEELLPEDTIEQVKDYQLDQIPLVPNTQDVTQLLLNPEDADDEKINQHLYELSLVTRELIKDAGFNKAIIKLANASTTQTASLLDLETEAPAYYATIDAALRVKGLSLKELAKDLTHRPLNPNPDFPETAQVEQYFPAIFIPNLAQIDPDKQPLISPNIEVDSRNDESLEDNIVAWFYTEAGELQEIMLSEETATQTSNPLFLLDNAAVYTGKPMSHAVQMEERVDEEGNVYDTRGQKVPMAFHSNEFSIEHGYRYESGWGNKSEFCIVAYRIDPSGTVHWIYSGSGWKKIAEVKPSQIGQLLGKWTLHAPNWEPYSTNYVFWNTFERDWNRSLKDLGDPSANGLQIYLAGNMKYSGDWYAWIPSTVQIHNTKFNWVYNNWAHWFSSWKSQFRIWRVE